MEYREGIAKLIKRLRIFSGVSQEKMAFDVKIDRRYMSDIENGKRNISVDILNKIAAYFGMSTAFFMYRVENDFAYDDSNNALKESLIEMGYEDAIVFENPSYRNAVVGISEDGRVIYSERIIIEDMIIDEELEYEDAIDHFNYNLMRALPYMGEMHPIILRDLDI